MGRKRSPSGNQGEIFVSEAPDRAGTPAPAKRAAKHTTELQLVIDAFHASYRDAYGMAFVWAPKDFAMLKRLVLTSGHNEVVRRIAVLFTNPPKWLKPPHDVGTLSSNFNKLIGGVSLSPSQILAGR